MRVGHSEIRQTADRMIARYGREAGRVARDTLRLHDVESAGFDFWLAVSEAIDKLRSHRIVA